MFDTRATSAKRGGLRAFFQWLTLGTVFGLISISHAGAKEVLPWHVVRTPHLVSLYLGMPQAESDADSPVAGCVPRSGKVIVYGVMNEAMRLSAADTLKSDGQLTVTLGREQIPPVHFAKFSISYSDMDGWIYELETSVEDPYLKTFRKAGMIAFKLSGLIVERINEPTSEIPNIGKFIDACAMSGKR